MIVGVVNSDREATLRLQAFGLNGQLEEVEFVIDTGFTGHLTMPTRLIALLHLPYLGREQVTLADGSTRFLDVHSGNLEWDGKVRRVEVVCAETQPLLGMAFLYGHKMTIEALDGGDVTVEHL